jgi:hypothetical protein
MEFMYVMRKRSYNPLVSNCLVDVCFTDNDWL